MTFIIFGILIVVAIIVAIIIRGRSEKDNECVCECEIVEEDGDTPEATPQVVQTAVEIKPDPRLAETDRIVKKAQAAEKDNSFITDDEVRFRAYMIASADNFKGDAREYWVQAEKELRGTK